LREGVKVVETKNVDSIYLKLDKGFFGLDKNLYIGFTYIVPSNSTYIANCTSDVDPMADLESFVGQYRRGDNVLIMGDLNARIARKPDYIANDSDKFGSYGDFYEVDQVEIGRCSQDEHVSNQGSKLLDICRGNKMRVLNGRTLGDLEGKFTCHQKNGSSAVDFGIVNEEAMHLINVFRVHDFMGDLSDHCMISTQIRCRTHKASYSGQEHLVNKTCNKPPESVSYKWNSELDGEAFLNQLKSEIMRHRLTLINENLTVKTCDESINELNRLLRDTANNSIQIKSNKSKRKRKAYKKWYNTDCEIARKNLKQIGSKLHKSPFNNKLREDFFRQKKQYKKLLKYKRKTYKQDCINKLENMFTSNPKEYWKTLNDLKNETSPSKDQEEYISLDSWADHFKKLNEDHIDDPEFNGKLEEEENKPHFSALDFKINENEVKHAIKKLKPNKASGNDKIIGEMIKAGTDILVPCLTNLFNIIFRSKEYPKEWNKGIITAIHKKGSKYDPNNYRGITVNSVVAKVYSMVLCSRLEKYVEENKIMNDTQIGFKKNAQTVDHVLVLQALTEKYKDKDKLHVCFIDFKKAYDSVWRKALLYKLLKLDIRGLFYHQIKAMYENVLVCVKQNGHLSDYFKSEKGVKQGEVLSPLLFNLFINDLNDIFTKECAPVQISNRNMSCLQYADDLILVSETKDGLQNCLNELNIYCNKWKLDINTDKSKAMEISKQGRKPKGIIKIGDIPLEYVNEYTYLGIVISSNGKFTLCKKELTDKGRKAMNKLKGLLSGSAIKKSLAIKMFDQLVMPILTYGSEIWAAQDLMKVSIPDDPSVLEDTYQKLPQEKLNIHFCKYILGVSSKSTNIAAMAEVGRYPISIRIITQLIKYFARVKDMSPGSLLSDAMLEMETQTKMGKMTWLRAVQNAVDILGIDIDVLRHCISKSDYEKKKSTSQIRRLLEQRYNDFWGRIMNSQEGKLELYKELKINFKYEEYLDKIKDNKQQRALTKLRISNHKLFIETGRYKIPYVDRKDRICQLCSCDIEDESHFMFKCHKLSTVRKKFFGRENLNGNKSKLLYSYLAEFRQITPVTVAAYVCEALELREYLSNPGGRDGTPIKV